MNSLAWIQRKCRTPGQHYCIICLDSMPPSLVTWVPRARRLPRFLCACLCTRTSLPPMCLPLPKATAAPWLSSAQRILRSCHLTDGWIYFSPERHCDNTFLGPLGNPSITESQLLIKDKSYGSTIYSERNLTLYPCKIAFNSCFWLDSPEDETVRPSKSSLSHSWTSWMFRKLFAHNLLASTCWCIVCRALGWGPGCNDK